MATPTTGLTHIVLLTPKRRADLTLANHVTLAHLQPTLLRHGGEDLVEDGVSRGGWVVRRLDGTSLDPGKNLAALGVRNGDVLVLSYRDQHWPEPSFDDLADGIADDAAKLGASWQGRTTARAGIIAGASALAGGLWLILVTAAPYLRAGGLCLAVAVLLLGSATLESRLRRNSTVAGVLGVFSMVYATAGGLLVLGPTSLAGALASWYVLAASVTLVLAAVIGRIAVGGLRTTFYAGATLGLVGMAGALLAVLSTTDGAAAGTAAGLILLAPLLPRIAALQGGLPTPGVPNPAHGQTLPEPMPKPADLAVMVRRADELLTGVLTGGCTALFVCAVILGGTGHWVPVTLAYLAMGICALRMRMFAAVRHRLPLALTSLAGVIVLLGQGWLSVETPTRAVLLIPVLGLVLLVAAAATAIGGTFARRPPSPRLGRLADIVEVLSVIATPILASAVMGLFGLIRGLLNG